jgi:hypothetical protein
MERFNKAVDTCYTCLVGAAVTAHAHGDAGLFSPVALLPKALPSVGYVKENVSKQSATKQVCLCEVISNRHVPFDMLSKR